MIYESKIEYTELLVIGCGGAGLRASIEAKQKGLEVKVIGKRSKKDSHTVLAAGGINASFGNVDSEDTWQQHFADTYLEGYKIGDPDQIEILAKNSKEIVSEIDSWGANFEKLENGKLNQRYFGAHTFRRTCFSGDFTGQSILEALLKKADSLKIPIFDNQYVTELLIYEKQCFGALSFDLKTGKRIVHLSNATILCTGGHTRIWGRSSCRKNENMGDGFYLALKAGCELIDMEMVQFHPTGMLFPEDMNGFLVTEAVRGEGGILTNKNGERFMQKYDKERLELSTRDRVAIANYTEITEGRSSPNGGVFLDISHKDKELILTKLPRIYKQFLEFQNIDISKEPMEVGPTAHYSMGGINVNSKDHSTNIKGLFAAGEVAGGLHGANRLGGNSLAEILVFGKIAGAYASEYCRYSNKKEIPKEIINIAHKNIDQLIKKGGQQTQTLQEKLRVVMWKYCGVVRNKNKLMDGLEELKKLNIQSNNVELNIKDNNFNKLAELFDLKASLMTAKATILSALERKESRGAHVRSDFPTLSKDGLENISISLNNERLYIKKFSFNEPNNELKHLISKTSEIRDFSNKLLE